MKVGMKVIRVHRMIRTQDISCRHDHTSTSLELVRHVRCWVVYVVYTIRQSRCESESLVHDTNTLLRVVTDASTLDKLRRMF